MCHPLWFRFLLAFAVCAASLTAYAPTAVAQEDKARAIELITAANKAYDAGDFRTALSGYKEAYDITEDPRVLYRIGLTYENLANYQRAREHLELFLLAEPDSKYAGRVKSKIDNLRKLETNLQAAIRVSSAPPGADVWVNDDQGKPAGVTPVRIPVGPGSHTLILKKEGYDTIRSDVEVETGDTVEQAFDLEGGGVAETTEEITEEDPEVSETAETETSAEPESPGVPTRTYIGPSTGVTVLCWLAVGIGWIALIGATVNSASIQAAEGNAGFVGLALVAVGGYFLWFHDWTRDLPDAQAGSESPASARFLGLGIRF